MKQLLDLQISALCTLPTSKPAMASVSRQATNLSFCLSFEMSHSVCYQTFTKPRLPTTANVS